MESSGGSRFDLKGWRSNFVNREGGGGGRKS